MIVMFVVAGVVLAAIPLIWWIAVRRRKVVHALPPLLIPLPPNTTPGPPIFGRERSTPPAPEASVRLRDASTPRSQPVLEGPDPPAEDEHGGAETVRFFRPGDNAVQLLPGRLEVLAGTTTLREIRFVRIPGEPPHLILGRDPGPSPQHVGLGSVTVSRRHARFDYAGQTWEVRNLSRTNPLVVNDDELSDSDAARPLADGDRLELGEVVLRFHTH